MSNRKFHHGALRQALLDLAEREVEASGHEALSLRDLAASLGVSPAAPYRHFASKNDLLLALAQRGLEKLSFDYDRVREAEASPTKRLKHASKAYLDFARDRPEMFRLIFAGDWDAGTEVTKEQNRHPAFEAFERLVAENIGGQDSMQIRLTAMGCWSLIHGFAMLRMKNRLAHLASADAIEDAVLAMVCNQVLPD